MRGLRQTQGDGAIDCLGLWKTATLPFLGGVRRRIGFSSETIREFGVPLLYTDRIRCMTTHIADQNGELSLRTGARRGVADFTMSVPAADDSALAAYFRSAAIDRYLVLSPGGG